MNHFPAIVPFYFFSDTDINCGWGSLLIDSKSDDEWISSRGWVYFDKLLLLEKEMKYLTHSLIQTHKVSGIRISGSVWKATLQKVISHFGSASG